MNYGETLTDFHQIFMSTTKMSKRRKSKVYGLLICCCLFFFGAAAQDNSLTKDELVRIVKAYHPVVRQADINISKAGADIQNARGQFDPLVSSGLKNKELSDKLYYSYFYAEVNIPTWYGIDIKAGTEETDGVRLSPEATPGSLNYVGVKFSLNGVIYDKRRAALQQAKIFLQMSLAEKKLAVNDVLFDAVAAYWAWVKEYEQLNIVTAQMNTSRERLAMVKGEAAQGARPDIDTVEAYAQYYTFVQQYNNAEQLLQNATLALSAYLWLDDGSPYTLPQNIIPGEALSAQSGTLPDLATALESQERHPKLEMLNAKLDILQIEKKLKMQSLIPKLAVNAASLNYKSDFLEHTRQPVADNYKLSLDVSVPIFMRETRGSIRSAKLKIDEMRLERSMQQMQLSVKLKAYYNEYLSLARQIDDYTKVKAAYQVLYNGEMLKFRSGESTLFLVNSRELKMLEAAQKLVELQAKQQKAYVGILYAAGLLM
jgi:outer membrane protein TolC